MVPEATTLAVGVWLLPVTVALAEAVQPLDPVTITEYVPGALTTKIPVLLVWPLKLYDAPPEAVKVADPLAQVMVPEATTEAVGTLASPVTVAEADAVQPLDPVTITEYVPGALTTKIPVLLVCPLNV